MTVRPSLPLSPPVPMLSVSFGPPPPVPRTRFSDVLYNSRNTVPVGDLLPLVPTLTFGVWVSRKEDFFYFVRPDPTVLPKVTEALRVLVLRPPVSAYPS